MHHRPCTVRAIGECRGYHTHQVSDRAHVGTTRKELHGLGRAGLNLPQRQVDSIHEEVRDRFVIELLKVIPGRRGVLLDSFQGARV